MRLPLLNRIVKGWVTEHKFHPTRKWRFDFCHPVLKIAVEVEGGVFSFGRHTRGSGFLKDMEKYNAAVILGWRVLRYETKQIGEMVEDVEQLIREV